LPRLLNIKVNNTGSFTNTSPTSTISKLLTIFQNA